MKSVTDQVSSKEDAIVKVEDLIALENAVVTSSSIHVGAAVVQNQLIVIVSETLTIVMENVVDHA